MPAGDDLKERFQHASKKPLGTEDDVREVKRIATASGLQIDQILWVSPTEVIVSADDRPPGGFGTNAYLIDIHKGGSGWQSEPPCFYGKVD